MTTKVEPDEGLSRSVLVTGASGLVGANVVRLARERGYAVRALVRPGSDVAALEALGAQAVEGDVAETDDVHRASDGVYAVLHCAAVLGGTWGSTDPAVHDAVNVRGTVNVLDAAAAQGARVVALSTVSVLASDGRTLTEQTPISSPRGGESDYVRTKRTAILACAQRASAGQHVQVVVPGAIYGPSPVAARALHPASQNAAMMRALRGELRRYPPIAYGWVLAEQVARRALVAVEVGDPGDRYLAMGDGRDDYTYPAFLTAACAAAGVDYRVQATAKPSQDPSIVDEFGPIAFASDAIRPEPPFDDSWTVERLGDPPVPVAEGLARTIDWLRRIGEL